LEDIEATDSDDDDFDSVFDINSDSGDEENDKQENVL